MRQDQISVFFRRVKDYQCASRHLLQLNSTLKTTNSCIQSGVKVMREAISNGSKTSYLCSRPQRQKAFLKWTMMYGSAKIPKFSRAHPCADSQTYTGYEKRVRNLLIILHYLIWYVWHIVHVVNMSGQWLSTVCAHSGAYSLRSLLAWNVTMAREGCFEFFTELP